MAILPPKCFSALDCPICRSRHGVFVDKDHQPSVFCQILKKRLDDPPFNIAYVCPTCQSVFTPLEFIERVREVVSIEKEQHRFWLRVVSVLECNSIEPV